MKQWWLLSLIGMVTFVACQKKIESLPPETQTGANTFGAKVNGENWGPLKAGVLPTAPLLEARFSGNRSIVINARNFSRTPIETEMELYLHNVTEAGTYRFTQNTARYPDQAASYAFFEKRKITIEEQWITGGSATGQVVVSKLDVAARIISGTFRFTAVATYGSTPLVVTEGRFDLKIQ